MTRQATATANDIDQLLDLYGSLKDEVMELKERRTTTPQRPTRRRIAPGHSPYESWSPCDQEEVRFYGSLTHLH